MTGIGIGTLTGGTISNSIRYSAVGCSSRAAAQKISGSASAANTQMLGDKNCATVSNSHTIRRRAKVCAGMNCRHVDFTTANASSSSTSTTISGFTDSSMVV